MKKIILILFTLFIGVILTSCLGKTKYEDLPEEKQNEIGTTIASMSSELDLNSLVADFPTTGSTQEMKDKYINNYKKIFSDMIDKLQDKYPDVDFSGIEDNYKNALKELETNLQK